MSVKESELEEVRGLLAAAGPGWPSVRPGTQVTIEVRVAELIKGLRIQLALQTNGGGSKDRSDPVSLAWRLLDAVEELLKRGVLTPGDTLLWELEDASRYFRNALAPRNRAAVPGPQNTRRA